MGEINQSENMIEMSYLLTSSLTNRSSTQGCKASGSKLTLNVNNYSKRERFLLKRWFVSEESEKAKKLF